VVLALVWVHHYYGRFFRSLIQRDVSGVSFHWLSEVWPFQWRIALSWLSGYFMAQLFNPVLFAAHGPIVAGRMGMSLSIGSALVAVSFAWMSTKASPFGVMVARRQWGELDALFFRTVRQSFFVLLICCLIVLTVVVALDHVGHPFSKRLLDPVSFCLLLLSTLINHIIYCEALYLRTHKKEPFLIVSVVVGILTATATLTLAGRFGAVGVSAGYLACCLVGLVMGTVVFLRKRSEWHA